MSRIVIFQILSFSLLFNSCSNFQINHSIYSRSISSIEEESSFPNYFLPKQYRDIAFEDVPTDIVFEVRTALNSALERVYRDIEIPIVDEEQNPKKVRYFSYLKSKITGDVDIMPSGGVVRSSLSYIYDLMYTQQVSDPITFLNEFSKKSTPIPSHHVRGLGSDWDILIKIYDGSSFEEVKNKVLSITNSSEEHLDIESDQFLLKRSIVTVGDVKEYDEQITRASNQGGSTLDFLAYSTRDSKIIEPTQFSDILNNFIKGRYSYVKASSIEAVENPHQQSIRGLRPLLELPQLNILDDNILFNELNDLIDIDPSYLGERVVSQFSKMVRNSRYSGAKNRFYKENGSRLERKVYELNSSWSKKLNFLLIPEFIDWRIPKRIFNNSNVNQYLLDVDTFVKDFTDSGVIYHGTSDIQNALSILRQGLILSNDKQGVAAYGRGAYASNSYSTSLSYASEEGIVFPLEVNKNSPLRIIDWEKVKDKDFFIKLSKDAKARGEDVFEILAKEYKIDIIINNHILIQNAFAVKPLDNLAKLVNAFKTSTGSSQVIQLDTLKSINTHHRLYKYASALYSDDELLAPIDMSKWYAKRLKFLSEMDINTLVLKLIEEEKRAYANIYHLSSIDHLWGTKLLEEISMYDKIPSDLVNVVDDLIVRYVRELINKNEMLLNQECLRYVFNGLKSIKESNPSFLIKTNAYLSQLISIEYESIKNNREFVRMDINTILPLYDYLDNNESKIMISEILTEFYQSLIDDTHNLDVNTLIGIVSKMIEDREFYPRIATPKFYEAVYKLRYMLVENASPSLDLENLSSLFFMKDTDDISPLKDVDFLDKMYKILLYRLKDEDFVFTNKIDVLYSRLNEQGMITIYDLKKIIDKTKDEELKSSMIASFLNSNKNVEYSNEFIKIYYNSLLRYLDMKKEGDIFSELLYITQLKSFENYLIEHRSVIIKEHKELVSLLSSLSDFPFVKMFFFKLESSDSCRDYLQFFL